MAANGGEGFFETFAAVVIVRQRLIQEGEQAALHDLKAFSFVFRCEGRLIGSFNSVGSCGGSNVGGQVAGGMFVVER